MENHFLFRLDMAKDNDEFFNARKSRVDYVYAGTPIKVGPGWIPDFVEVILEPSLKKWELILIELDATEPVARASCRKYLPEPSEKIAEAFLSYLDTIVSQCRSTADPRHEVFSNLKESISTLENVVVCTAGGLRKSAEFLEVFPLMGQPEHLSINSVHSGMQGSVESVIQNESRNIQLQFVGEQRFNRLEKHGIIRAIRVFHAILAGRDHSGGTFASWRNLRGNKIEKVENEHGEYPSLHKLLSSDPDLGVLINCDDVSEELARLWHALRTPPLTSRIVADVISSFATVAMDFQGPASMRNIFDVARAVIETKTASG